MLLTALVRVIRTLQLKLSQQVLDETAQNTACSPAASRAEEPQEPALSLGKQPGCSAEPCKEPGSPGSPGRPGCVLTSEAEGYRSSSDSSPSASRHPGWAAMPFPRHGGEVCVHTCTSSASLANKLTFTAGFRSLIRHTASMLIHLFLPPAPASL